MGAPPEPQYDGIAFQTDLDPPQMRVGGSEAGIPTRPAKPVSEFPQLCRGMRYEYQSRILTSMPVPASAFSNALRSEPR